MTEIEKYFDNALVSYSQCLEDIVIYKLLSSVQNGFYIDIGCGNCIYDNVTKLFYDKGWRGINIDALAHMMTDYSINRPEDINLNLGISDHSGKLTFFVHGGLSTFDIDTVERLNTIEFKARTVEVTTSSDICARYLPETSQIHFLKLDVERHEAKTLAGMNFSRWRPWVLAIESTLPCTEIPCWHEWEPMLFANGYSFFIMHKIMRYYIANEHVEKLTQNWIKNAIISFAPLSCHMEIQEIIKNRNFQ